jgi:hypothetical protein
MPESGRYVPEAVGTEISWAPVPSRQTESAVLCPLIEVNRPLLLQCGNACFRPNPVLSWIEIPRCSEPLTRSLLIRYACRSG